LKGETVKRSKYFFKAAFVMLIVAVVTPVSNWAFAQGGSISGSAKDLFTNRDIQRANLTIKDVSAVALAGTANSDVPGNYLDSIVFPENSNLPVLEFGYDSRTTPEMIKLTETTPIGTGNILPAGKTGLNEKPVRIRKKLVWETYADKSYLIPALEIPAFIALLNVYDRHAYPNSVEPSGKRTYFTTWSTFANNMRHQRWVIDQDSFSINQLGHPYQGSMYYGFARSAGLSYWKSLLYTNAGSFLWEMGAENSTPSINDQIASGIGGSFFGEALFRLADLLLDREEGKPWLWREIGAAVLSPPTGINRLAFGDRFKTILPTYDPAFAWRLRLGLSTNPDVQNPGLITLSQHETTADYAISYGLPGKPGYTYKRPFDYFHFEFTSLGNPDNPFDNIMIRGFLLGRDYDAGDSYRGIWGLYGGYDYISPHIFRISSTSASLGTTFQWWLGQMVALQGSALGGFGYAAAGNVTQVGLRDYHYGFAPQGLAALRLIFGDRAMLDLTGRAYYITGAGGNDPGGREAIDRLNMGLTVRVYRNHGLGIQYIASTRDARYPNRPDSHQSTRTVSLVYTLMGDSRFGAVEWHRP
jgi:hypothetical protein